jgi:hypothetical protein
MSITLIIPEFPQYSIYPFTGQYEEVNDIRKKIPINMITDLKKKKIICEKSAKGSDIVLKFYPIGQSKKSLNNVPTISAQLITTEDKSILFVKSHNKFESKYEKDIIKALACEAKRMECSYVDVVVGEDVIYSII